MRVIGVRVRIIFIGGEKVAGMRAGSKRVAKRRWALADGKGASAQRHTSLCESQRPRRPIEKSSLTFRQRGPAGRRSSSTGRSSQIILPDELRYRATVAGNVAQQHPHFESGQQRPSVRIAWYCLCFTAAPVAQGCLVRIAPTSPYHFSNNTRASDDQGKTLRT